ncbi:heavy-metal-associated domain-containing protein [uncultured Cyclobacterium sp.]|uniref:heavy-metal-associated domain-containing protein n=1 Tax=uncultured Cyclobacterium sp. TaxID=453820 RepID=UPI0030EB19B8|tara:strand:- start:29073 stop:29282 length:210 start_codon:yes stop_codon:yes gene_type:complete
MNTLKFKTNINCGGCLSKVTPFLNEEKEIEKWDVNLKSENRVLTVETSKLNAEEVKKTVQKAGFNAEAI